MIDWRKGTVSLLGSWTAPAGYLLAFCCMCVYMCVELVECVAGIKGGFILGETSPMDEE